MPDSDTDIMIEINPEAPVGVWEYAGIREYIAALFDGPVDVSEPRGAEAQYPAGRYRRCDL